MNFNFLWIAGSSAASTGDQSGDEFVEPTPKRRVLMPREASITAKARLSHQTDDSSPGFPDPIPETQQPGDILPIPDYDLSTGGPPYLNTSLPVNLHKAHLQPGTIVDPVLSGNHALNATVSPPTTYADFSKGLVTPKCPGTTAQGKRSSKKS